MEAGRQLGYQRLRSLRDRLRRRPSAPPPKKLGLAPPLQAEDPLYYPGNIWIRVIRAVCVKRAEKRVAQARRIRWFPPTGGVTPVRFEIHERADSAGGRGASHLVVSP